VSKTIRQVVVDPNVDIVINEDNDDESDYTHTTLTTITYD